MASFNIELRTGASLHPDGEPSDFVSEYAGVITCVDDETGAVTKVGRVAAMRVHAALAHNAGESLFDVCDSHSGELNYLHALLYEPERYHFREEVMARFDAAEPDLLVLDYVVLSPKWRKLKLGLLAVRKLVDLIGSGCGLAVSDISPLRHDAAGSLRVPPRWLTPYATDEERRAATVRLRRYYRRMGFSRLGRTPYYALPLNRVTPTATELLEPEQR
ncbi:hypothetical protein GobsT_65620 [Gemmata obscuriglobus]|uniref:Uncharacterized protein n=1 Tax=Gemmata obscuriglobus TaxID=114 RepID=A0A2Z3GXV1_9BACT|nr:hypothetical protein [Gemmata obscuriglobus]AWM35745.1 hypothetical protein C1280_01040 [Gemmata obscuriglobus]QEG31718.1 hypothetical protein GobsT_65620 [Gemmata obscuriglobus]VTS11064.1 Uncharacterized protein OS=Herminiimonas arsenicoxydans GN=HEAR3040 PE=4 SV=1 [Gemmata obscuriglobus UQM 2246]